MDDAPGGDHCRWVALLAQQPYCLADCQAHTPPHGQLFLTTRRTSRRSVAAVAPVAPAALIAPVAPVAAVLVMTW